MKIWIIRIGMWWRWIGRRLWRWWSVARGRCPECGAVLCEIRVEGDTYGEVNFGCPKYHLLLRKAG
jgi:hypothetical protein